MSSAVAFLTTFNSFWSRVQVSSQSRVCTAMLWHEWVSSITTQSNYIISLILLSRWIAPTWAAENLLLPSILQSCCQGFVEISSLFFIFFHAEVNRPHPWIWAVVKVYWLSMLISCPFPHLRSWVRAINSALWADVPLGRDWAEITS